MATTTKERHKPSLRSVLTAAMATAVATHAWPPSADATEWRITPTLNLREVYSDNVRLSPRRSETSDWITHVTPGFRTIWDGPRLQFRSRYDLHALAYADNSASNRVLHNLDAYANAEMVDDLFFIDGTARVTQQTISLLGPQPIDNTSITDNRSTVKAVAVSPYLRHTFGSTAASEVRYRHSTVTSSTGGLLSDQTDSVLFNVTSGPAFRTLGWGLRYNAQKTDFGDGAQTVDYRTGAGTLRYLISPQFQLTATAGYDKYDYLSIGEPPEGPFYSVGFNWKPSERTSVSASAGRRFWGKTYALETNLRGHSSLWRASYTEGITTTQSQFALQPTSNTSDFIDQLFLSTIPDPEMRQQAVDRFILSAGLPPDLTRSVNYFTNQFFLQKSLQGSVAFTGARNIVIFNVFNVKRDADAALAAMAPLTAAGRLSPTTNSRQTGASALWNLRITPLMDANFSAEYSRIKQLTTDTREHRRVFRTSIARRLGENTNGVIELRRQIRTSDIASLGYVENAIAASLSIRF